MINYHNCSSILSDFLTNLTRSTQRRSSVGSKVICSRMLFTSDGGCRLLCQQSLFLLMQVLQLSLVFPLQLIYHLLMGLLHGGKAPLTRGLWDRKTWCNCEFMGLLDTDQKAVLKLSRENLWALQYEPVQIIMIVIRFQQITCKLQPVSHERAEPVWVQKGLRGMTGYTIHWMNAQTMREEGVRKYMLPCPIHSKTSTDDASIICVPRWAHVVE